MRLPIGVIASVLLVGCAPSVEEEAYQACLEVIDEQLFSPSTAEYADFEEALVHRDGMYWMIVGHVDSQTPMGGTGRSKFYCQMTKGAKTEKWIAVKSGVGRQ